MPSDPILLLTSPAEMACRASLGKLADRTTLVLGCGRRPIEGAINHDRTYHSAHVDMAFDLDSPTWPLPDERFRRVVALDVFEHLRTDIIDWVRECWRILEVGGELVLRVAHWSNPVSYRDPTHHRVFHEESFDYFCPASPLYREYGTVYFGEDCPTFELVSRSLSNADPRWPDRGDLCVVLRKVARS